MAEKAHLSKRPAEVEDTNSGPPCLPMSGTTDAIPWRMESIYSAHRMNLQCA